LGETLFGFSGDFLGKVGWNIGFGDEGLGDLVAVEFFDGESRGAYEHFSAFVSLVFYILGDLYDVASEVCKAVFFGFDIGFYEIGFEEGLEVIGKPSGIVGGVEFEVVYNLGIGEGTVLLH